MKRLFSFLLLAFAIPAFAQVAPDGPEPKPEHNFFLNAWNTPIIVSQAGGAIGGRNPATSPTVNLRPSANRRSGVVHCSPERAGSGG